MKKTNFMKIASLVVALFATSSLYAQGFYDLRINEVLINNSTGIVNGEGGKCGWIELRNSGYSTAQLAGCRLIEVTPEGRTEHLFPKGLSFTNIAPQEFMVIYLGATTETPNTTSFDLKNATALLIYDSSGKILIDSVALNPQMAMFDKSMGRAELNTNLRSVRDTDRSIEMRDANLVYCDHLTPGYSNFPPPAESHSEAFRRVDPSGIGMTVIAMSVVFAALLCLYLVFDQVGKAMQRNAKKKEAKKASVTANDTDVVAKPAATEMNGEMLAAIGYAISKYNEELNESEARVLTINRTVRAYSPWSSKIYGLTQLPTKK